MDLIEIYGKSQDLEDYIASNKKRKRSKVSKSRYSAFDFKK